MAEAAAEAPLHPDNWRTSPSSFTSGSPCHATPAPAPAKEVGNIEHIVATFREAVNIRHIATFRANIANIFGQYLGCCQDDLW